MCCCYFYCLYCHCYFYLLHLLGLWYFKSLDTKALLMSMSFDKLYDREPILTTRNLPKELTGPGGTGVKIILFIYCLINVWYLLLSSSLSSQHHRQLKLPCFCPWLKNCIVATVNIRYIPISLEKMLMFYLRPWLHDSLILWFCFCIIPHILELKSC